MMFIWAEQTESRSIFQRRCQSCLVSIRQMTSAQPKRDHFHTFVSLLMFFWSIFFPPDM